MRFTVLVPLFLFLLGMRYFHAIWIRCKKAPNGLWILLLLALVPLLLPLSAAYWPKNSALTLFLLSAVFSQYSAPFNSSRFSKILRAGFFRARSSRNRIKHPAPDFITATFSYR